MSAALDRTGESDSPKRQAVLEAAQTLFIAQGYGAVSMDAVARAAGVSKATLYAHFASKDQLFATIIGEACSSKIAAADFLTQAEVAGPADLRQALQSFGVRMLRFLLEPRTLAIYRVILAESPRFPELGEAFYENGPRHFRFFFSGWLAEQMAAGRLRQTDPGIPAEQFMALIRGTIHLRASLGLPMEAGDQVLERHVASAVDTFIRAFGA